MNASRKTRRPLPAVLFTLVLMMAMSVPAMASNFVHQGHLTLQNDDTGSVHSLDIEDLTKVSQQNVMVYDTEVHISCSETITGLTVEDGSITYTIIDFYIERYGPSADPEEDEPQETCSTSTFDEPESSQVTVTKSWEDQDGVAVGTGVEADFEVTLSLNGGTVGSATLSTSGDGGSDSATFDGLLGEAIYEVDIEEVEDSISFPDGCTLVSTTFEGQPNGGYTVEAGSNLSIDVTNVLDCEEDPESSQVTVAKSWEDQDGDAVDNGVEADFDVTLSLNGDEIGSEELSTSGDGGSDSVTFDELTPGETYDVSIEETGMAFPNDQCEFVSTTFEGSENGGYTVEAGSNLSIDVTNVLDCEEDPESSQVTVVKSWEDQDGDAVDNGVEADFEVTLSLDEDEVATASLSTSGDGGSDSVTFDELTPGETYDVSIEETEMSFPDGCTLESTTFDGSENGTYTVEAGSSLRIAVTNVLDCEEEEEENGNGDPIETGEVTVAKSVLGDAPDDLDDFGFDVQCGVQSASFELGDGESETTTVTTDTTCTVTEQDAQGADVSWEIDGDGSGEGLETEPFDVGNNENVVVTFTNDFGEEEVLGETLIAVDFAKDWTGDDDEADLGDVSVTFDVNVDGELAEDGPFAPGEQLEIMVEEGSEVDVEIIGENVTGFNDDVNERCEFTVGDLPSETITEDSVDVVLTVENEIDCAEVRAEVEVDEEEEELPETGASTTFLAILGLLGMASGALLLRRRTGMES